MLRSSRIRFSGEKMDEVAKAFADSTRFFRNAELIGEGNFGVVHRIEDALGRSYAVKVTKHPNSNRLIEKEDGILSGLIVPAVPFSYGTGLTEGKKFLVMDYIPGVTWEHFIKESKALRDTGIRYHLISAHMYFIDRVCEILDELNRQGIGHFDPHPGNVIIGESGVFVIDFGNGSNYHPQTSKTEADYLARELGWQMDLLKLLFQSDLNPLQEVLKRSHQTVEELRVSVMEVLVKERKETLERNGIRQEVRVG